MLIDDTSCAGSSDQPATSPSRYDFTRPDGTIDIPRFIDIFLLELSNADAPSPQKFQRVEDLELTVQQQVTSYEIEVRASKDNIKNLATEASRNENSKAEQAAHAAQAVLYWQIYEDASLSPGCRIRSQEAGSSCREDSARWAGAARKQAYVGGNNHSGRAATPDPSNAANGSFPVNARNKQSRRAEIASPSNTVNSISSARVKNKYSQRAAIAGPFNALNGTSSAGAKNNPSRSTAMAARPMSQIISMTTTKSTPTPKPKSRKL
ncbi:hypothetical protein RUND412_011211 [Rhizina undulata]